jgi:hypothetical protein
MIVPNDSIWKDLEGCGLTDVQSQLYLARRRETTKNLK